MQRVQSRRSEGEGSTAGLRGSGEKRKREGGRDRGGERERERLRCRESTRTIIRSRASSSKDPRDDISMPCLRNNFNYPRYTKKNTKSNARNSGEWRPPSAAPFANPWPILRRVLSCVSFIDIQCNSPCRLLTRSLFILGRYVPAGPAAMPMDYHGLSCRTSRAQERERERPYAPLTCVPLRYECDCSRLCAPTRLGIREDPPIDGE